MAAKSDPLMYLPADVRLVDAPLEASGAFRGRACGFPCDRRLRLPGYHEQFEQDLHGLPQGWAHHEREDWKFPSRGLLEVGDADHLEPDRPQRASRAYRAKWSRRAQRPERSERASRAQW